MITPSTSERSSQLLSHQSRTLRLLSSKPQLLWASASRNLRIRNAASEALSTNGSRQQGRQELSNSQSAPRFPLLDSLALKPQQVNSQEMLMEYGSQSHSSGQPRLPEYLEETVRRRLPSGHSSHRLAGQLRLKRTPNTPHSQPFSQCSLQELTFLQHQQHPWVHLQQCPQQGLGMCQRPPLETYQEQFQHPQVLQQQQEEKTSSRRTPGGGISLILDLGGKPTGSSRSRRPRH